jgi:hypothetical protein
VADRQIMTGHEPQPVNASQDQTCLLCKTIILPAQPVTKISGKLGRGLVHDACLIRRPPMIGPQSGA